MKKTQIYLDTKTIQEIKYYAAKNNIPYAQVVRDAIAVYLPILKGKKKFDWAENAKKYAVNMKKDRVAWVRETAEKYSSDMGGDVSQHIDDILYGE